MISRKIIFSVLALCSLASCDENRTVSETRIIPITTKNFPHTHERIMVPVDPDPVEAEEENHKPVKEESRETNLRKKIKHYEKEHIEVPAEKPKQMKRNPKYFDDGKGNYHKSFQYNRRSKSPPSKTPSEHRSADDPSIKPLNINTQGFKKTPPKETGNEKPPQGKYQSRLRVNKPEDIHEMRKMIQDSRKRLKKENLPENPTDIPATSWFDNTGKYNYGIIHDFKEPEIYKNGEAEKENKVKENQSEEKQAVQVFKSSFRDPKASSAQVEHKASGPNLGNFLYKSEVFYPSYRENLYPPVITYGDPEGNIRPATKELPTKTSHDPPSRSKPKMSDEDDEDDEEENEKPSRNHEKPSRNHDKPSRPNNKSPKAHEKPPKKQEKSLKPKEKQVQDEEDYDDDDADYEDPGNNDKYDGEAPGNDDEESDSDDGGDEGDEESDDRSNTSGSGEDDEEEESEEKSNFKAPKYRYAFDGSGRHDSGSEESDEFEKAWSKFGYGRDHSVEEDEDESETQVKPQRIKFHYEKKEEITNRKPTTTEAPQPKRKLTRAMSGSLQNHKPKAPKKNIKPQEESPVTERNREEKSPKSVKSQVKQSQPTDDLKFFQYFNYLGDGKHTAGGRLGNDNHYVEQHERGDKALKKFQKKVRWADKHGGFGEHYWDLNH